MTFAEARFDIEQITDPARRADLVQWLDRTLRTLHAGGRASQIADADMADALAKATELIAN